MARVTLADRYRAHREAFLLAQELGCTPKEAELALRGREARERWEQSRRSLEAKMAAPARVRLAVSDDDAEPPAQPWMMRD